MLVNDTNREIIMIICHQCSEPIEEEISKGKGIHPECADALHQMHEMSIAGKLQNRILNGMVMSINSEDPTKIDMTPGTAIINGGFMRHKGGKGITLPEEEENRKAPGYRIIRPESCGVCYELTYSGGLLYQCDKYRDQKIHEKYINFRICDDFKETS